MAMEALVKKSLILTVEEGLNDKGEPITKRYTYSNIKGNATPDKLVEAAVALAGLCNGPANFSTVITNELV
ncbi:DUF1659 domain-containing protein [Cytobacillus sp. FJAT-53684]|uniref:DUF1659 domain-containing protein n=1 Tax=Cytobacillus mangrovibacter TaxID=3299024 RepID=A0ABW6K3Q8_9BACI